MPFTKYLKFVKFRIYGNLWEKKESSGLILFFDPQCHTLVTFFLNLPISERLLITSSYCSMFGHTSNRKAPTVLRPLIQEEQLSVNGERISTTY